MLTVLFRCADGAILLRQLCGLVCESSSVSLGTLCCNNSKDWGNHDTCVCGVCVWCVCGCGEGGRVNIKRCKATCIYRITRMFCENQTLVNTHDPCQNAIVRSQRVKFSADLAHSQRFFTRKIF